VHACEMYPCPLYVFARCLNILKILMKPSLFITDIVCKTIYTIRVYTHMWV
jgi:hypothetical protein